MSSELCKLKLRDHLKAVRMCSLILAFFLAVSGRVLHASSLGELDQILTQAEGVDQFLNRPELVEQYYQASASYYGGERNFPRESYNAILKQMRIVSKAYPEFAGRAWESQLGRPFQVSSKGDTYGRNVGGKNWDQYWASYKENLRKQAGDLVDRDWKEVAIEVNQALLRIKTLIQKNQEIMQDATLKKSEKQAIQGQFFQTLKNNPDILKVTSLLILKELNSGRGSEAFGTMNSDLILNYLKSVKDQPQKLLGEYKDLQNLEILASSVKSTIPDLKELLKDESIFPRRYEVGQDGKLIAVEAGSKAEWNFVPSPRRFHAFFKGIYFGECVGGSNKPNFLHQLSPERWATIILKGTEFHFIETNGRFQGWVQAVPVSQSGNLYASVDLASYSFRQSILQKGENDRLFSEYMLSGWLREAMKHKPESWHGFVVGQSNAINNGGALPALRSSPNYLLGRRFPVATLPFSHTDSATVHQLVNIIPPSDYAQHYSDKRMIFDASVNDAGDLTMLVDTDQSLYDLVRAAIAKGDKAFVNSLIENLHKGAMSNIGNEILTLRGIGILKMLRDAGFQLPNKVVHYSTEPVKYINTFLSAGMSIEELKYAQFMLSYDVGQMIDFTRKILESPLVVNLPSFIKAISYERTSPSDSYKASLDSELQRHLPILLNRFPDAEIKDLVRLEALTSRINTAISVLKVGLKLVKGPQDYVDLFKPAYQRAGDPYKAHLNQLVAENFSVFLSLKPSQDQILSLINFDSKNWGAGEMQKLSAAISSSSLSYDEIEELAGNVKSESLTVQLVAVKIRKASSKELTFEERSSILKVGVDTILPKITSVADWESTLAALAQLAPSAEALVGVLTQYKTSDANYRKAIARVNDENFERLISMASYEQLILMLNNAILFEKAVLALMQAAIEKAKDAKELSQVFSVSNSFWKTEEILSHRLQILSSFESKLNSLPDIDENLGAILNLRTLFSDSGQPKSAAWVEAFAIGRIQLKLNTTKVPYDFMRLLQRNSLLLDKSWKHKVTDLAKSNFQEFVNLNPSSDQIKWYRSTFLSTIERLTIRTPDPQVAAVVKSTSRCESLLTGN